MGPTNINRFNSRKNIQVLSVRQLDGGRKKSIQLQKDKCYEGGWGKQCGDELCGTTGALCQHVFPEATSPQLTMASGCVWGKHRTLGQGRAKYLQHGGTPGITLMQQVSEERMQMKL